MENRKTTFARLNVQSFKELSSSVNGLNMAILYAHISIRANFTDTSTAFIGDFENMGLTRQKYRTALKSLEKLGYIKVYSAPHKGTTVVLLK